MAIAIWYYPIIVFLALTSAIFNMLNIGLMGLDPRHLELQMQGPFETKRDERDGRHAGKIIHLRKKGN